MNEALILFQILVLPFNPGSFSLVETPLKLFFLNGVKPLNFFKTSNTTNFTPKINFQFREQEKVARNTRSRENGRNRTCTILCFTKNTVPNYQDWLHMFCFGFVFIK